MAVMTRGWRIRAVTVAPRQLHRPSGRLLEGLRKLIAPCLLVILWEVLARANVLDTRFIPAPSEVLAALHTWIFGTERSLANPYVGTWTFHALESTYRVVLGFAFAAVIGTVLGILIGTSRLVEDLLDPIIQVLRPVPTTAWVPFAVVLFGIRTPSSVFLIAFGAFFPVVINTIAGVKRTPQSLIRSAQMLGTPSFQILPRVVLPAALPSIFTGLRVAMGLAWVLVVVSEMLAVKGGLGYVLWDAYYNSRMDIIVAAMISIGVLGLLSDQIVLRVGGYLLRWNEGG